MRYWGEQPHGVWQLHISDHSDGEQEEGVLKSWRLTFYGSLQTPNEIQERNEKANLRHKYARNEVILNQVS